MSIMTHVKRRVSRTTVKAGLKQLRKDQAELRQAEHRYDGGLAAEVDSLNRLRNSRRKAARTKRRQLYLSRIGRRIHLAELLKQRRQDGTPKWTIVDPAYSMTQIANGKFDTDGQIYVGMRWVNIKGLEEGRDAPRKAFVPAGMPALPQRVRDLATDKTIRKRARWVGVLYQPEEWHEVDPDPALVVEWEDIPGEYYALAVWGDDMPQIMEFVD